MRGRIAMGICVAALCAPAPASATVWTVTTTDDHFDQTCDADCSLRDALNAASSADSVTLPAGVYTLDPTPGELDLVGDKLNGAGARSTIIDGGLATRVMATTAESTPAGDVQPQVSGVTVRRGRTFSGQIGGGIQVVFGALTLVNSQVISNTADGDGGGIGLSSGTDLFLIGSTVAGNASTAGRGGGIFSANEGAIAVANSTISGNTAGGEGGGFYGGGGTVFSMLNATIAGNSTGQSTGGLLSGDDVTLRNTIFAGNGGAECSIDGTVTSNNSLSEDATCGLVGNGNITFANPLLGPLANNGGPTDTRALAPTSPAIDHGGAGCEATDQRGVAREGACDIGAYEYRTPPPPPPPPDEGLPDPVQHKNVNALPESGTVRIKLPGEGFRVLREGEQIPLGTTVDTRKGRVKIVAAAGSGQTADFYEGLFKLSQTKGKKPITVLTLVEKLTGCKTKKKASAAAKKKRKRRLWGDGRGRFRTKGKHSAATVVGTKWLVEDRCTSTLTRVRRGKVKVRDFVKHKTVTVKAGKRYIARKRR